MVQQLAETLTYVHRKGFLHLDLKPSNVVYDYGHAILIDFSVAERYTPGKPHRSGAGTCDYMAPEQTHKAEVGPWTDVFGLGMVFCEFLTGGESPYPSVNAEDPKRGEPLSARLLRYAGTLVGAESHGAA